MTDVIQSLNSPDIENPESYLDEIESERTPEYIITGGIGLPAIILTSAITLSGVTRIDAAVKLTKDNHRNHEVILGEYNSSVEEPYLSFMENIYNELEIPDVNKKQEIIKEIIAFKSLINKWDGYNALPLEVDAAANAIYFISSLPVKSLKFLDDYYPNPHGTITFEWINNSGEMLGLEIGNSAFSYYLSYLAEPIYRNNLPVNDEEIKSFVEQLNTL
jgi:hypothetical protein